MPVIYADTPFVAISQDTKRALEAERMTNQGIEVVLSGVDSRCVPGEKAPVPTIVYTGRLQRYKRVDALIAAMPSVLERVPEARLIVVGTGDERDRLEHIARSLGVGHAVSFTGFVDEEAKIKLLAGAWVFVSPSSMEGWGITAAEALACGTPCVVYDVPGLREVVEDGRCGSVFPEGSDLSRPILEILTDESLREKLSAAATLAGVHFHGIARLPTCSTCWFDSERNFRITTSAGARSGISSKVRSVRGLCRKTRRKISRCRRSRSVPRRSLRASCRHRHSGCR